jgi:hypothetical protein
MVVSEAMDFPQQQQNSFTGISRAIPEPTTEPFLQELPKKTELKRWKCHTCHTVIPDSKLVDGKCPVCTEGHLEKMCELDHTHCIHEIIGGYKFCEKCGKPVCPECYSHDVIIVSRVTGYLQDFTGWNSAKQQELKDRVHWNLGQK